MASPSSNATNWDPLGANSPAGRALIILRPENAAAKLAFSEVVDFIQEQTHRDDENLVRIQSHYAQFIWFADEQVSDPAVTRLVNQRRSVGSSSPSSSSEHSSPPVTIWTGFYFLDPDTSPLIHSLGWSGGRLKTQMACVSLDFGDSAVINNISVSSQGSTVACANAENSILLGDLRYTLENAPHCRRSEGQARLRDYLTAIHGDDQPTKEALLATPTPTMNAQTIGSYTITAAGMVGKGSFGRVRPATGPDGKLVAIKTLEKAGNTQPIREKIDMIKSVSQIATIERQTNILSCVESIHMGGNIHEFHIVLEPFVDITLDRVPLQTHRTKLELILRDCLQGLSFLHAHDFVHTDIKPTNIGLVNLRLDHAHNETSSELPPRPLRAVLLDLDSIEKIHHGRKTIPARPGTNGTIGFHSPEHESVSLFRVAFGRLPWSFGTQGNPWRRDVSDRGPGRISFHSKYRAAITEISNQERMLGGQLSQSLNIIPKY
ncbi:kinase-like domain-containing protein [Ilyonectria robusta]|uniref:kinase-like domain-containing protein n=1 Tax=Ilyonectria robusta TaxID=1079257 RepID=UPI001E8E6A11|nr:kinase-like domain-containing protein [Ilyonectria robusta]KAH8729989.1 kinase-like domain-containing protein [Ilyonectria robusta]